jgi:hypothetical protein
VRLEGSFDAHVDDLWSALTDPGRLTRWLGEVEGDLRRGGEFRARFFATGWKGTGRLEAVLVVEDRGLPLEQRGGSPVSGAYSSVVVRAPSASGRAMPSWADTPPGQSSWTQVPSSRRRTKSRLVSSTAHFPHSCPTARDQWSSTSPRSFLAKSGAALAP